MRTLTPTLILVVSEKIHQVTPEFNKGTKKLSDLALYTLPTQPRQVLVEPAALVSIERWILPTGGGGAPAQIISTGVIYWQAYRVCEETANLYYTISSALGGFTLVGLSSISAVTTGSPNMEDERVCTMISLAESQSYVHCRAEGCLQQTALSDVR